jgi:hypothetical protein
LKSVCARNCASTSACSKGHFYFGMYVQSSMFKVQQGVEKHGRTTKSNQG